MKKSRLLLPFMMLMMLLSFGYAEASPKRIISLTPVGTEILFELGQGDNIIGVTDFCDYPAEAAKKPKMGDFAAVNFEAVMSMKTDLLLLQDMHMQFTPQLDKLRIPYLVMKQNSIDEICDSIIRLGKVCSAQSKAAKLVSNIRADVDLVTSKVKGLKRPKVILCVSRELSEYQINSFYVASNNNFYGEMISLAGGENAVSEKKTAYPQVSLEGLMKINPSVIIDLVGDKTFYHSKDSIDVETIFNDKYLRNQWERSAKVDAVKKGRIYIMQGTVYLRPGARSGKILKAFAKAIHPEVKW
ncbi:MAG TPA: ABC transporter substrate-binding protein [Synergistaceae bacterium]|nr:ABC transporter substrate-binding protein [Synergistaceae bacterium]